MLETTAVAVTDLLLKLTQKSFIWRLQWHPVLLLQAWCGVCCTIPQCRPVFALLTPARLRCPRLARVRCGCLPFNILQSNIIWKQVSNNLILLPWVHSIRLLTLYYLFLFKPLFDIKHKVTPLLHDSWMLKPSLASSSPYIKYRLHLFLTKLEIFKI